MYIYYSSPTDIKKLLTNLIKSENMRNSLYNIIITALWNNITDIKEIYPDFGTALETALQSIQNNNNRKKQKIENDKKKKAIQNVLNSCKIKKEKYISDLTYLIRKLNTIEHISGINNNKLDEIQKQKYEYQSILECILATNRQNVPRNNKP